MSTGTLVLLTGISGFIGAHVADELLASGYRVRGCATPSSSSLYHSHLSVLTLVHSVTRTKKVAEISERYADRDRKVEIVAVDDIAEGDFTDALKGVGAVIHGASPMPGNYTPEETIRVAEQSATNVLRQAEAAGITNFVFLGSIVATYHPGFKTLNENDWNNTTREEATSGKLDAFQVYAASKALAEKAVWEFGATHPHVEIASVNPGFNLGSLGKNVKLPPKAYSALSSNALVLHLFDNSSPLPWSHEFVSVHVVARALVRALTLPPTAQVGRKRFPLVSREWAGAGEVVRYLEGVRPELKGLFTREAREATGAPGQYVDLARAEGVLGVVQPSWQEVVLEAVDTVVALKREWEGDV
ncbi:NAD(P)-binding protein [Trametopsis cervina]|nr:NAD(P)-binding protein [Trametopsis cervina]